MAFFPSPNHILKLKAPDQLQSACKESLLILPEPGILESCIKIKINLNFVFTPLLWGPSKGFMKAFKAIIKPFEAPQRSVKMKI